MVIKTVWPANCLGSLAQPRIGLTLMAGTDWPTSRSGLTAVGGPTNLAQSETLVTARRLRCLSPIGVAAYYLNGSRATIERLVNRGGLPIVMIAESNRFDGEELDIAFNRRRNRKRTPEKRDLTRPYREKRGGIVREP
jgi:hypothetical protein